MGINLRSLCIQLNQEAAAHIVMARPVTVRNTAAHIVMGRPVTVRNAADGALHL